MFCSSCGKKITENSKFCKFCGANQLKINSRNKSIKKIETWTCEYCDNEFKTKKEGDKHELRCIQNPKNNKFPLVTNPRRGWFYLWITTLLTFTITLIIWSKYSKFGIDFFKNDNLTIIFLLNIGLGFFSFLAMVPIYRQKKNQVFFLTKFSLVLCFIYFLISSSVFAIDGYIAKNNEKYKNKYYSSQSTTPTTVPKDSTDKLLSDLNNYRTEQKMSVLTLDDDLCKVAEKLLKKENLKGALNKTDYIDLCPKCNGVAYAYVENVPLINVFPKFKEATEAKKIIDNKNYKYGCFAIDDKKVLLFIGNKTSSSAKTNTVVNNSGNIECIGPDGKNFWTSMDECKKLNEKWGKPLDYMTNCEIHPDCGSGTIRMSYSQCMKPCSGLSQNSNNTQSNINNSSTNTSNKAAVFLTYGQYTIYCPSQNVEAVKSIDATMKSKSTEWAKNYNDCTSNFFKSDSCYVSCSNINKSELDTCYSKYGYSGSESKACTDPAWDNYSNCIKTCPSTSEACDYVYLERKSLSSQIDILCK